MEAEVATLLLVDHDRELLLGEPHRNTPRLLGPAAPGGQFAPRVRATDQLPLDEKLPLRLSCRVQIHPEHSRRKFAVEDRRLAEPKDPVPLSPLGAGHELHAVEIPSETDATGHDHIRRLALAPQPQPPPHQVRDAWLVPLINCSTSFLAGVVVFSILGYMAHLTGQGVDQVVQGGTGLAFVVYPESLAAMPGAPVFSVLFFTMLLTLGIASAFSLLEAFNTVLYDRVPWCNLHKSATTAMVCTGGFLVGLLMTTNGGSHVLDVFDHYLSDFLLVIIGMTECIFVGWTYDMDRLAREIEEHTAMLQAQGGLAGGAHL